ncbi:hypothetical protein GGF37_000706 [Kickxella alabastrina]|nr:hypothetical protein GGF37_000706 [Kickxella alabastrina]
MLLLCKLAESGGDTDVCAYPCSVYTGGDIGGVNGEKNIMCESSASLISDFLACGGNMLAIFPTSNGATRCLSLLNMADSICEADVEDTLGDGEIDGDEGDNGGDARDESEAALTVFRRLPAVLSTTHVIVDMAKGILASLTPLRRFS